MRDKYHAMPNNKKQKQPNKPLRFQGFSMPHYTQVPDELFDTLMPHLSGAELKVLLYIIRRTFGFKKQRDPISLSQMVNGIKTKEGTWLDRGTGLGKSSVTRALNKLEEMQVIQRARHQNPERGDQPTIYALKMRPPVSQNETPPRPKMGHPVSQQRDTQQTAKQQTEKQQAAPAGELLSFGIDKPTIDRLVKTYDAERIAQKIDYVIFMQEEQPNLVRSPRGWLLKAIEQDYGPPAGYRPQAKRKREAAEKVRRVELTKQQKKRMQQVLEDAEEKRKEEEEKALKVLQERYGTTEADIDLWQSILDELRVNVGGLTYASAKAVDLLTVEDDIAFFAAKNKYSVDRINDNSIGEILAEMFRKRGYNLKDMKPVIMQESVLQPVL